MIKKIGHQAPKGVRINRFNSIEINGDFAYCVSHNFVYNPVEEKKKLYNGEPCYYTDYRYVDGMNFYKNAKLHWTRFKDVSLKACIRKVLNCKNIPVDTIINFNKSWYYVGKKIDNSFKFKVKKENNIDIRYEINRPSYSKNFTKCEFSKKLTNALRKNGFIVSVQQNESFILNMIDRAAILTGSEPVNIEIDGEIATAYGYGKQIGFSSFNNDYRGYSNGCDNILWDKFGEFNKWSECYEIPKTKNIKSIIQELKEN